MRFKIHLKNNVFCIIVTADKLFDQDGNVLGLDATTNEQTPVGEYLSQFLSENLGVSSHVYNMGASARITGNSISEVDNNEAFEAGKAAVIATIEGKTAKLMSMKRKDVDGYGVEMEWVALDEVTSQAKVFPTEWVHENAVSLRHHFLKYAQPLIQGEITLPHENGLPNYVALSKNPPQLD